MEAANAGAIKWGDKYVVVARVEGAESRHTTAMVGAMRVGRGPRQPLSPLRRQAGPGQGPTVCWDYIKTHLLAPEGEWYWSADEQGQPNTTDDRTGFWKCPYHNTRMCLETITMLS